MDTVDADNENMKIKMLWHKEIFE